MHWPIRWEANWIWAAPAPAPISPLAGANIPSRDTWNRFCFLRRALELEAIPKSVPARVTADSRFVLYINGVEVGRGPTRSVPQRMAWSEFDLARQLRSGRNAIAALVRFYGVPGPWWSPAPPSYQLGFGSFAFEAPAIGVSSDAGWKGRVAPYRQHVARPAGLPTPPIEIVNGAQWPFGWHEASYDDSAWDAAVVLSAGTLAPNRTRLPIEPYSAPEADRIGSLTALEVSLTEVARRTVASIVSEDPLEAYPKGDNASAETCDLATTYGAGGITLATPWVNVRGPAGAIVDIYTGEELAENGIAEINPRRYAMRYILGGTGLERAEAYEAVGFRYLTVLARNGAAVEAAGAIERCYPRVGDAFFECDDQALNTIWRVGARTLELCSTDAFIDCPGREQRAWVGDSYVHALLTYTTSSDWRLVQRHLRICAHSRRSDGLLAMVAAGDLSASSTTIPDYSLHWIRALARYFEYSADAELVRELFPTAIEIVNAFERYRGPNGLIRDMPGWVFIDWAMIERAETTAALDALYAAALGDLAKIAGMAAGDARAATVARERAAQTRIAFEAYWDQARGVYVDAADKDGPRRRVSQQTNAAAILGGCAPRERWARMLEYILADGRIVVTPTISDNLAAYLSQRMDPSDYIRFDSEREVVAAQPFFSHLLHEAIVRAGRRDLIAQRCMKWWPQIERGNTCFEEYWNARPGSGSRCHAWSATPTYDLTAHVLGVRPASPGFATVEIAPRFGHLEYLKGRVPTPHGMIEVALNRQSGGEIMLPAGVIAHLRFEDAALSGGEFGSKSNRIRPLD
jgi:alpha-L-rhamnosidase